MMGRQISTEPLIHVFCLEYHVPLDHPLRQVDRLLDLGFVREGMTRHTAASGGPRSIPNS